MATIISNSGGGSFGGLFPPGYPKMKSTALGDTFPGWSADIIPICININTSRSYSVNFQSGQRGYGDQYSSTSIKGTKAVEGGIQGLGVYCTADGRTYGTVRGYSGSVFLPFFYNFNFEDLKNDKSSIRSMAVGDTATVWLER